MTTEFYYANAYLVNFINCMVSFVLVSLVNSGLCCRFVKESYLLIQLTYF